ncbi:MAG: glucoamylase family protein [Nibricoccus sp.]
MLFAKFAACLVLVGAPGRTPVPAPPTVEYISSEDGAFLDDLQLRSLRYFDEHSDPVTGLTRDRAPIDGSASEAPASVAATGFALTAWCIGEQRGWLSHDEVVTRARRVLHFVHDHVEHEHGWLYHFVNVHTGKRVWLCEASTIDTALFLKGAILAREYLRDPEVTRLVNKLYARIDWRWALNNGATLTHGWRPETGFIAHRWDSYSELLGLYLLGIGAPSNALPATAWNAWRRGPVVTYGSRTFIHYPPLFAHQYAHAWFDFRGKRDHYADYWQNSVDATLAQRDWCADLAQKFTLWSRTLWGVTASDSARGYMDWGGPTGGSERLDGTLVPCAPGGSLPFAPRECLDSLRNMRAIGGDRVWGRYGFADAFNPQTGWVSHDVIAIDVGITLVMAENLRSEFVWRHFMRAPEARRGLALAGFKNTYELPANSALALAAHEQIPVP